MKQILRLTAMVVLVTAAADTACSRQDKTSSHDKTSSNAGSDSTGEPSSADLIQAVRNSVIGKTFSRQGSRWEQQQRTCSQFDVDMDPNAKHNPELAKCPRVGAVYRVPVMVPTTETVGCPPLTAPDSEWTVQKVGPNAWRLSQSGSAWDVTKIEGQSNSAGKTVRTSRFNFAVNSHQAC